MNSLPLYAIMTRERRERDGLPNAGALIYVFTHPWRESEHLLLLLRGYLSAMVFASHYYPRRIMRYTIFILLKIVNNFQIVISINRDFEITQVERFQGNLINSNTLYMNITHLSVKSLERITSE